MQLCKVALEILGEVMELIEHSTEFSRTTDRKGCLMVPFMEDAFHSLFMEQVTLYLPSSCST